MSRRARILKDIGFLLGLLLLIEGLGQLFVKFYAANHFSYEYIAVENPETGWDFKGSRHQGVLGYGDFELSFNSQGIRSAVDPVAPGSRLFLGSSLVLAQQVPLEQTFADLNSGFIVGLDGYSSYQLFKKYDLDVVQMKPKELIWVFNILDVQSHEQAWQRQKKILQLNPNIRRNGHWGRWLKQEALWKTYLWFDKTFQSEPRFIPYHPIDSSSLAWSQWTDAVEDFVLKASQKTRLYLVLSPLATEVAGKAEINHSKSPLLAFITNTAKENGVDFLDLTPVFGRSKDPEGLFLDSVHYSQSGHKLAAEKISELLQKSPRGKKLKPMVPEGQALSEQAIHSAVESIFQRVFGNPTLEIQRETTADDIPGWDSLNQINIVAAIEDDLGIKFALAELSSLKNVGGILDLIDRKIKGA